MFSNRGCGRSSCSKIPHWHKIDGKFDLPGRLVDVYLLDALSQGNELFLGHTLTEYELETGQELHRIRHYTIDLIPRERKPIQFVEPDFELEFLLLQFAYSPVHEFSIGRGYIVQQVVDSLVDLTEFLLGSFAGSNEFFRF